MKPPAAILSTLQAFSKPGVGSVSAHRRSARVFAVLRVASARSDAGAFAEIRRSHACSAIALAGNVRCARSGAR